MKKTLIYSLALLVLFTTPARADAAEDTDDQDEQDTAPQALTVLKEGNLRFVKGSETPKLIPAYSKRKIASEDNPNVVVLSCSDMGLSPEEVFDQDRGRIFSVRVAGNIIDRSTVASIEYAVEHLDAKLVVVMGHESCGAVKVALSAPPGQSIGSRDLDAVVASIRPNLVKDSGGRTIASGSRALRIPVKANVNAVAQDLMIRSKIIRRHVDSGDLAIVPAMFSHETGYVEFWNTDQLEQKW